MGSGPALGSAGREPSALASGPASDRAWRSASDRAWRSASDRAWRSASGRAWDRLHHRCREGRGRGRDRIATDGQPRPDSIDRPERDQQSGNEEDARDRHEPASKPPPWPQRRRSSLSVERSVIDPAVAIPENGRAPFRTPADYESPVALRPRLATGVLFRGDRSIVVCHAPTATHPEDRVPEPVGQRAMRTRR